MQGTAPDLIVHGTPAYRRMSVALLMAGFSTFALMYDVQPLLPLFTAQFGVNAATSSLAVSLTTGTMALAFIPAAVLSDRVGRRSVMIFSLMVSAALTWVIGCTRRVGRSCLPCAQQLVWRWRDCPVSRQVYIPRRSTRTSIGSASGCTSRPPRSAVWRVAWAWHSFPPHYMDMLAAMGLMGVA